MIEPETGLQFVRTQMVGGQYLMDLDSDTMYIKCANDGSRYIDENWFFNCNEGTIVHASMVVPYDIDIDEFHRRYSIGYR